MTARTRLAALLALLPVSLAVLAGCGGDDEPSAQDPNDNPSQSGKPTKEQSPTEDPTQSTSDSGSPATVAAPIYFVGDTPQGPRLFREFQQVEADNPMAEAVALMTAGDADDPDYGTLYPEGSFASVAYSEGAGAIVVQVNDDSWSTPADGMTKQEAKLAVQQLVYTVQGVQQERLPVLVQMGSDPVPLFGIPTEGGLKEAPQNNVLALVNVTQPQENSEPGATFVASGVANSFEATVPWQVRDESGAKVLEGFATAEGWGDHLYPWESQVDASGLPPGTYTFVAMTDDPSGGEGGGPTEDTKTFTLH
jgi:immunoglobulin-like protein involved in spore germination/sporulation and spore germination protein